ncbi:hypothetical protein VXP97_10280, partial [Acinetobacter sp. 207]
NNIQKSRVVSGLVFFFHLLFLVVLWLSQSQPLFNPYMLPWVLGCLILYLLIALVFICHQLSYS